MITIKHGSIFDSRAQVLVCPVNCVGVMGKGLALEFKRRCSDVVPDYKYFCEERYLWPGKVIWMNREPSHGVMFFATKKHWRNPSKIEWIDRGIEEIAKMINEYGPGLSIALPQLGCGCGVLDWADVWPLYERHLGELNADVEVWIYE